MCIFSVETSCDDTCFTVYNFKNGVLFEKIYKQSYIHNKFKGVVPNIALSEHKLGIQLLYTQLGLCDYRICYVAYTQGPGLSGSLFMGVSFAKAFTYFLNVKSVNVNHLEGHLLSIFLTFRFLMFPYIALLISGGHTFIIYVHCMGKYVILGMSLDDSVGESFDKVACYLGLGYPGGPLLEYNLLEDNGTYCNLRLPRPMFTDNSFNFSYSGIKTNIRNYCRYKKEVCVSKVSLEFHKVVFDTITNKVLLALRYTNVKNLVVVGGVAANFFICSRISYILRERNISVFSPVVKYCTDNAAMVALTGYIKVSQYKTIDLSYVINHSSDMNLYEI